MKKLFIIVTIAVAILAIHAYSYAQNSIINNWNVSTINAYNSIVDSKSNPGDGIYTIEKTLSWCRILMAEILCMVLKIRVHF